MFEAKPPLQGKFITNRTQEDLKSRQTRRAILQSAATVIFIVPILSFPNSALEKLLVSNLSAVIMAYTILVFFTALWMLTTTVFAFTIHRFKPEIPAANAPKLGFAKHTWSTVEWQLYLSTLGAIANAALCVYAFSIWGLALTILTAASIALCYIVKNLCRETYDNAEFIGIEQPPSETETPSEPTSPETSKTETPDSETSDTETLDQTIDSTDSQNEDFYDR